MPIYHTQLLAVYEVQATQENICFQGCRRGSQGEPTHNPVCWSSGPWGAAQNQVVFSTV